MTFPYPVRFAPISMERMWGGHKLKSWFEEERHQPVGEYWVLSGHPNGTIMVVNGPLAGQTLMDLCVTYPKAYLGKSPQNRFPLLIKFLEAERDLSVQIHPDDTYAQSFEGDFGKTEAWYVLHCGPEGRVIHGHQFSSREDYLSAVANGNVKNYLCYHDIQPGQIVFVPAKTLHALLAGTTVIEVQQTSDVTYRVYDWDRLDEDGLSRELHVSKAADVLQFDGLQNGLGITKTTILYRSSVVQHEKLLSCPYFTMERISVLNSEFSLQRGREENPDILIVAAGRGIFRWSDGETLALEPGHTLLIPTTIHDYEIQTTNSITIIRTFY